MVVSKDKLVTISVVMSDLQGHVLERSPESGLTYLHGHADIFPAIEAKLEGKKTGDSVSVVLEPEEAFGEFDPDLIYLVDAEKLGDVETLVPGLVFDHVPGQANDGRRYTVTEIAQGKVVMDANHPLAGWSLKFDIEVLAVESAQGETTGTDEIVVPEFLGFADKIIDDETDDGDEERELQRRLTGIC